VTTARLAATRVLLSVDTGRDTLAASLERERAPLPDVRDRALCGEIATGALRWRNELDALLEASSRRRAAEIDEIPRAVLRLAAYQLRHLDRVPSYAVVHESVECVRALGAPKAAGFVNAVLRQTIRLAHSNVLPSRPATGAPVADQIRYLSVTLSHPAWLVERWLSRHTFDEVERWCQFNNAASWVTVRSIGRVPHEALLEDLQREGTPATPARFVSDAIRLPAGTLGSVSPALRQEMLVQDEGAQLVARVAGVEPGERVLDLCAAPGGKTVVAAADLQLRQHPGRSTLVACDYRVARVRLLRQSLLDAGLPVPIVRLDARVPLPFGPVFDCVILDAPCSGLGTLRRDPDLKWSRTADDLPGLVADEDRMLDRAADAVRPGGRLIYATCSSEPEENSLVVQHFLSNRRDFSRQPAGARYPAADPLVESQGYLATLPFRDELDAFFAAVLVRQKPA